MEKLNFYVAALPYRQGDAGCMYLHKLAHNMQQLGENVTVVVHGGVTHPNWGLRVINSIWHEAHIPHHNSVAIYPEIVATSNPFNAELCVRWVLATPGVHPPPHGDHGDYPKKDLAYLWKEGIKIPDKSLVRGFLEMTNYEENLIFQNENRHVPGTACYMIRKGGARKVFDQHPADALCIDDFASKGDKEYLKEVFNRYETFICYDDISFIPVQAALCGCVSIVIPRDPDNAFLNSYGIADTKRHGVAYGNTPEQIQWAKDTVHLAHNDLKKQEETTIAQVQKVINDCYEWFQHR